MYTKMYETDTVPTATEDTFQGEKPYSDITILGCISSMKEI